MVSVHGGCANMAFSTVLSGPLAVLRGSQYRMMAGSGQSVSIILHMVCSIVIRRSRDYPESCTGPRTTIYEQFSMNPESLQWISEPSKVASIWEKLEPRQMHDKFSG